jgi:hypothetical protein
VAVAGATDQAPIVHSLAMDRLCPDRRSAKLFLEFAASPKARQVMRRLGYGLAAELDGAAR